MSDHVNNVCIPCGGKGFHYIKAELRDPATGLLKADIIKPGRRCDDCGGTGVAHQWHLTFIGWAVLLAFICFVLIPLIRVAF